MIDLEYMTARLAGVRAGIYGFVGDGKKPSRSGRFKLFPEAEPARDGDDDPALEGGDAVELEQRARQLGATHVEHWYEP